MFFKFLDNDTLHNDLIFNIGNQTIECDSYYFAIDIYIEREREDSEKIKLVLRKLLEQWKLYVSKAKSDETFFLPFDFSCEYTGCLKCEFQNSEIEIQIGYLQNFMSVSFFPSDISSFVKSSYYFVKSKDFSLSLNKSDFIQQIKENLKLIR